MVGASTELLRDMLLAAVSAGLGAILGSLLTARVYGKEVDNLRGQVTALSKQVNTLISRLGDPNVDAASP